MRVRRDRPTTTRHECNPREGLGVLVHVTESQERTAPTVPDPLVRSLERADRDRFEQLYADAYQRLVRTAWLLLDDRGAAEEVVQESFVRLHGVWDRVDQPAPYVRAIVVNLARSRIRRRLLRRARIERSAVAPEGPDELAVRTSEHQAVLRSLQALTAAQRAVVVCRYWLDLGEAETAVELGMAIGTVKSHAHRALRRIERQLEASS